MIRVGCLTGKVDGTFNATTKAALGRYLSIEGQPTDNVSVTEALVAELTKHATRVCPIECKCRRDLEGRDLRRRREAESARRRLPHEGR